MAGYRHGQRFHGHDNYLLYEYQGQADRNRNGRRRLIIADRLISDKTKKHSEPIMKYYERYAMLMSCEYVCGVMKEELWSQKYDDLFIGDTLVMGADWAGEFDDLEKHGVKVIYLPRTEGISTTDIKQRIIDGSKS